MSGIRLQTREVEQCHLCGAGGAPFQNGVKDPDHHIAGEWSYKICANASCSSIWLTPRPLDAELLKAYEHYHTHSKQEHAFIRKSLMSLTKRLTKLMLLPAWYVLGLRREAVKMRHMGLGRQQPGALLELGVGGGRFLLRMKKKGWDVSGVDFDPNVAQRMFDKYRIKVHAGDVTQLEFPPASFDVIAMNQTVEHLIDPGAVFQKCHALLKPGGCLVVTTPNVGSMGASLFKEYWRGWEPPRHLHLYTTRSMATLARHTGFIAQNIETYACESAIGYYASYMNAAFHRSEKITTVTCLRILLWSYWMELKESVLNRQTKNAGQGIFMVAFKSA